MRATAPLAPGGLCEDRYPWTPISTRPGPGHARRDPGLDEDMVAADPLAQFSRWLADATAAGLPEPNAMVLSTVSAAGRPRARTVLLKEHGPEGFVFYTNRTSAKGQDLAGNGRACCSPGMRCTAR